MQLSTNCVATNERQMKQVQHSLNTSFSIFAPLPPSYRHTLCVIHCNSTSSEKLLSFLLLRVSLCANEYERLDFLSSLVLVSNTQALPCDQREMRTCTYVHFWEELRVKENFE